jgi:hypothetical protein
MLPRGYLFFQHRISSGEGAGQTRLTPVKRACGLDFMRVGWELEGADAPEEPTAGRGAGSRIEVCVVRVNKLYFPANNKKIS